MRIIEAQTIQAIRDLFWLPEYSGTYWRSGNMEVYQAHQGLQGQFDYERTIRVELHGNLICRIWPADQILEVSDAGWRTSTTKSRINVILSCLCGDGKKSPSVHQRDGEWFLGKGVPWQGRHKFPYQLHCDNWSLNLAEKKAAPKRKTGRAV